VAGILARAGHRVTVYEQQAEVGGRCQGEWLESPSPGGRRFRFDTGPSLLLLPDAYRAAFARMGRGSLEQAGLKLRRVGPDAAYRVFFTDDDDAGGDGQGKRAGATLPPPPPRPPTRHLDLLYDEGAMIRQLDARGERKQGGGGRDAAAAPPPSAALAYRAWLSDAEKMLDAGWAAFIARDFGSAFDGPWRSMLRVLDPRVLLPLLAGGRLPSNPLEMLMPHASALARRFPGDPDLQALLSFQDLYVGLAPASAPGVFSLLAATELRDGVWYPEGGFGAVRDALLRCAVEAGAEVRAGARVRRVVVRGGGRVAGVELEGGAGVERADAVVCNADVPSAYALLADEENEAAAAGGTSGGVGACRPPGAPPSPSSPSSSPLFLAARYGAETSARLLSRGRYSAGVIAYYWCVEGGRLSLPQHTVFVRSGPNGGARAWRRARSAGELDASPNFYVHCPSRSDLTALSSPGDSDSVMVLLPVANLQEVAEGVAAAEGATAASPGDPAAAAALNDDEGALLVAAGRRAILRALAAALPGTLAEAGGASDLAERIALEEVRAPPSWRGRHALAHGAAFGLQHGLGQLAALRPALRDGRVGGFYCVGASARPGNGVPLVLTGAGLCADAVLADLEAESVAGHS